MATATDAALTARVRAAIGEEPGLTEKTMFRGTSFLVGGNIAVGVNPDGLLVRLGTMEAEAALARPQVAPFAITGKPKRGWVVVAPAGIADEPTLREWVAVGLAAARALPPKA